MKLAQRLSKVPLFFAGVGLIVPLVWGGIGPKVVDALDLLPPFLGMFSLLIFYLLLFATCPFYILLVTTKMLPPFLDWVVTIIAFVGNAGYYFVLGKVVESRLRKKERGIKESAS